MPLILTSQRFFLLLYTIERLLRKNSLERLRIYFFLSKVFLGITNYRFSILFPEGVILKINIDYKPYK